MLLILAAAAFLCSGILPGCGQMSAGMTDAAQGVSVNDPAEYFGISDDASAALVLNCELREEQALARGGHIWIPWELVWNEIDPGFYFEKSDSTLVFTCEDREFSWKENSGENAGNSAEENSGDNALLIEDGVPYLTAPSGYVCTDIPMPDYEQAVIVSAPISIDTDSNIEVGDFSLSEE